MRTSQVTFIAITIVISSFWMERAIAENGKSEANDNAHNKFLRMYPDLATHEEENRSAILAIKAEGLKFPSASAWYAAIAYRARTIVHSQIRDETAGQKIAPSEFKAQEAAARAEAERQFPQVTVRDSPFEQRLLQEREIIQRTYPEYFNNPQWPLLLTRGCAEILAQENADRDKEVAKTRQENDAEREADQQLQKMNAGIVADHARALGERNVQRRQAADAAWQQHQLDIYLRDLNQRLQGIQDSVNRQKQDRH